MSKNSEFKRRKHVVDHDYKKVYLVVTSWSEAMASPSWVNKYYPGYKAVFVTEQTLTDKENVGTKHKEE